MIASFADFWHEWRSSNFTHYPLKGGRNSAKSTTAAQAIILDIIELPINALVLRKIGRTLEMSVYQQLKEATRQFQCQDDFTFLKSPLSITYKHRGNGIIFAGADDPNKLKSIKNSAFPIARLWIEELTEFKTEEEVQTITASLLRESLPEGLKYQFVYSYNPPKRKAHWVNKKYESQIIPANTNVHHSSYLDNHYLSQQTLEEIEIIRISNERKYRWMYLGEPSGGGVVPFDNLQFRTITAEEIEHFDNIKQGLDFGYAVDSVCWGKMHYDRTRRKLYIFDEIYGVKISNRELAMLIKEKKSEHITTICDSAEPKSISELREMGIKVVAATKGEGSVEFGEKWLDDLTEIVIDPARCPNHAREFENIDYQVDKNGDLIARLEDKDNHSIDCARYSCEGEMKPKPRVRMY